MAQVYLPDNPRERAQLESAETTADLVARDLSQGFRRKEQPRRHSKPRR